MTNKNQPKTLGDSSTDEKYFKLVTITPRKNDHNTGHRYRGSDRVEYNTSMQELRLKLKDRQELVAQQLQRRIILLWNARTKYKNKKTPLTPNEKEALELWEHVNQCSDKGCRTKHCKSSRYALAHYKRCKRSNRSSTCKVCAPVTKYITREQSSINNRGNKSNKRENNDDIRAKRKKRTTLCDIDENEPFTGYESRLGLQCAVCEFGNFDKRMTPERSFSRSCIDSFEEERSDICTDGY